MLQTSLEAPNPPAFVGKGDESSRLWKDVQGFYKRRAYQPAWFSGAKQKFEQEKAEELMAEVAKAPFEGLDGAEYNLPDDDATVARRSSKREKPGPQQQVDAELRLSYSFMKYATHLMVGRVDPHSLDKQWVGQTRQAELPGLLEQALSKRGFSATFDAIRPRHPQYALLKAALQRYREIAAQGGWPTDLAADGRLKRGSRGPSVAALRARLQATGDLAPGAAQQAAGQGVVLRPASTAPAQASDQFDDSLARGLAHFEARHGLEADGALDKAVVAALNVPVEERIRSIELNLERWRWLPEELGGRFIMVNIPGFKLQAFDGGRVGLEMRVVTGTQEDPTPILLDEMTHVIFSPYWNIPPTIAREEWLPKLQKNPYYLAQNGIEVVKGSRVVDGSTADWSDGDLRLRQRPGARNALGLVKFAFPNRFNVYLHDTPNDSAFDRVARSLSHGCVRVERPLELAEWVLAGQSEWTRERIDSAMHAGTEKHVKLEKPIPVYLMYQTAWAADDGSVLFVDDLYGHDSKQLGLLDGGSPKAPAGTPPV